MKHFDGPTVGVIAITTLLLVWVMVMCFVMLTETDPPEPQYACPHCGNVYYESQLIHVHEGYAGNTVYYCPHCNAEGVQVIVHTS